MSYILFNESLGEFVKVKQNLSSISITRNLNNDKNKINVSSEKIKRTCLYKCPSYTKNIPRLSQILMEFTTY